MGYWTVITQEGDEWTAEIWSLGENRALAGRFTGPWSFVHRAVVLAPICIALWCDDRQFSDALMGCPSSEERAEEESAAGE